ncbi:cell end marker Tea3 [Schizosaccharomyces japonicus yFS275]|uniref:Cell end marker Tea3 n=1 Tax=Schizosaccharomyces japonicus (strain yFS275 / FY16936) TaxID=402676 RepID=B6K6I9_SCHJY|nr:cell end marker Tea3 [Schizosaccharomyces japonicus yFS275]EEB09143.2 cell end marker Tea3 [Schizosaccharomyces japonicus yFS275]
MACRQRANAPCAFLNLPPAKLRTRAVSLTRAVCLHKQSFETEMSVEDADEAEELLKKATLWDARELQDLSSSGFQTKDFELCFSKNNSRDVFLFGGIQANKCTNSLWQIDLQSMTIRPVPLMGSYPAPCVFHAMTSFHDKLYVFGGDQGARATQSDNTLFAFDVNSGIWDHVEMPEPRPASRSMLTMNVVQSSICIFGGQTTGNKFFSDLVWYDTSLSVNLKGRWELSVSINTPPPSRAAHASVVINGRLIIFGGQGEHGLLNDIWFFDFHTLSWTEVRPAGVIPCPRKRHKAISIGEIAYFLGGFDADGRALNELWAFNASSNNWMQLPTPFDESAFDADATYGLFSRDKILCLLESSYSTSRSTLTVYSVDTDSLLSELVNASRWPIFKHLSLRYGTAPNRHSPNSTESPPNYTLKHVPSNSFSSSSIHSSGQPSYPTTSLPSHLVTPLHSRHQSLESHLAQAHTAIPVVAKTWSHRQNLSEFSEPLKSSPSIRVSPRRLDSPSRDDKSSLSTPTHSKSKSSGTSPLPPCRSDSLLESFWNRYRFESKGDRTAWLEEQLANCMRQGYKPHLPSILSPEMGIPADETRQLRVLEILQGFEASIKASKEYFEQRLNDLSAENERLTVERDAALSEAVCAKSMLASKSSSDAFDLASERVRVLETEVRRNLEESSRYHLNLSALRQQLDAEKKHNDLLSSEYQQLAKDFDAMKEKLSASEARVAKAADDKEKMIRENDGVHDEYTSLSNAFECMRAENEQLKESLLEMRDRVERQTNVIEASASALDVSNEAILSLEHKLQNERSERQKDRHVVLDLQKTMLELEDNCSGHRQQITELEELCEQLKQQSAKVRGNTQAELKELIKASREYDSLWEENKQLSQQINALQSSLKTARQKSEKYKVLSEQLSDEKVKLQKEKIMSPTSSSPTAAAKNAGELLRLSELTKSLQRKLSEVQIELADSKMNYQFVRAKLQAIQTMGKFGGADNPTDSEASVANDGEQGEQAEISSIENTDSDTRPGDQDLMHELKEKYRQSAALLFDSHRQYKEVMLQQKRNESDINALKRSFKQSLLLHSNASTHSLSPSVTMDFERQLNETQKRLSTTEELINKATRDYTERIKQLEDDYRTVLSSGADIDN